MPIPKREMRSNMTKAAREAAEALFELLMSQKSHFDELTHSLGLSPPLAGTLWHLTPGTPMSMGSLANEMACDASNITGIVDRLESRGLVQRQPSSEDRRVKLLALTEEGVRIRSQFLQRVREPSPWILALEPEDQVLLRDLLRRGLERIASEEPARE